jgi:DNA repair protein RecO (recombination protein O)
LFTKDFGKIEAVGIGTKKIKSKVIGHLTTWGLIDVMIVKTKSIDKLATARLVDKFDLDIEENYYFLSSIFEIVSASLPAGIPDEKIWSWLNMTINWLKLAKSYHQKKSIVIIFGVQLLKMLGYAPELSRCTQCQRPVENHVYFHWQNNGIVCEREESEKIAISKDLIKLLRLIIANDWKVIDRLVLKKWMVDEGGDFLRRWISYVFEKEINSLKYI